VNRLTIPFAHTVIVSEALPKSFTGTYCAQRVVPFKGVDEVAWIKGFKPATMPEVKKPLIVLRQIETKAAYAKGKQDNHKTVAEKLAELGNVHIVGRYNEGEQEFGEKTVFEDTASLVANADLVVSYGGTISREAALQGVPSIAILDMAKTPVNTYLAKRDFPLFITTEDKLLGLAKKYLGKRFDVTIKLAELENPVDLIAKVVESLKA
jgi:predicted glycosyltransferase